MNVKYALIGLAFLATQSYAMEEGMSIGEKKVLLKKLLTKKAFGNIAEGALFGLGIGGLMVMLNNVLQGDTNLIAVVSGLGGAVSLFSAVVLEVSTIDCWRDKISALIDGIV